MKKFISVVLVIITLLGCVCLPVSAAEKNYKKYNTYVLLGDSAVSGYEDNGPGNGQFEREDFSFSAIVADTLGVENFYPRACPGFRTGDIRYILEDDYVEDEYLFYYIGNEEGEKWKPQIKKEIAEADLITLGIGGNDFGAYVTWIYYDIMEEDGHFDGVIEAVEKYIAENGIENVTLNKLIEIVDNLGHLDRFIELLPLAWARSHKKYGENWDIMIQDIYDINPDVDLLVMGMYNSAIKSEEDKESKDFALEIQTMIADWANTPMIESAEKFGYVFVDTQGTICDVTHPTREGQKFLAQRVLDCLPNADFPYTDVAYGTSCYLPVQYMFENDIMQGKTSTAFGLYDSITVSEFSSALNKVNPDYAVSDSDDKLSNGFAAATLLKLGVEKGGIAAFIESFTMFLKILTSCKFNLAAAMSKGEAAKYIYQYVMM